MKYPLKTRIAAAVRCLRGDMSAVRHALPNRRESETAKFTFADHSWFATISRFPDGRIAELFLDSGKPGALIRAMANDAATAASIALQYGCPPEVLQNSFTRDERLAPASPIGAVFDEVLAEKERAA